MGFASAPRVGSVEGEPVEGFFIVDCSECGHPVWTHEKFRGVKVVCHECSGWLEIHSDDEERAVPVESLFCEHFWGSHGCDLPWDVPHDIHECNVPEGPCSQMRVLSSSTDTPGRIGGDASVRFALWDSDDSDEWHWGDWHDSWSWFT